MSAHLDRRTVVRGAAWVVPVVLAAIAVPQAAASLPTPAAAVDRLTFNTADAWDENPYNLRARVGVVVAAMDNTGPTAIGAVVILVELVDAAGVRHQAQSKTETIAYGWGATPDRTFYFEGVARGEYTVHLTATAVGVKTITKQLTRKTVLR